MGNRIVERIAAIGSALQGALADFAVVVWLLASWPFRISGFLEAGGPLS